MSRVMCHVSHVTCHMPQGATLGILEYLSQSNNSTDCVGPDNCFKFVDDLIVLEIINLLTVGISSFNIKNQVPNDIPQHNQFIHPDNLKSQEYLDSISSWTTDQKMKINSKKKPRPCYLISQITISLEPD